jgi:hypothetical protein
MNGFVSVPPASIACPGEDCAQIVHADGFFPEIDLHDLRDVMRIGTAVTDPRLREAVIAAMTTTMRDLAIWRTDRILEGFDRADAIPGPEIDGTSLIGHRWRRAVYNHACGELCETHRDVSATGDGSDRAEDKALSADDYRRDALHAIRDILGESRIYAELI